MPTIILCGGRGTRISEVNARLPKPMLPVGGRPMLWHIMKIYATHGHTDFVLALGWLGDEIRRYVLDMHALLSDFRVEVGGDGSVEHLRKADEASWRVACIDTGVDACTGTRVRLAAAHLDPGPVMVTYGDGVGDIDVAALVAHHQAHGRLATVTAVRPPGRFGELVLGADGTVERFDEKPGGQGPINGGFMVLEREAIERFIPTDRDVMLEQEPLQELARAGQLVAFEHHGFWQPVDTAAERDRLEALWAEGAAPWATSW